MHLDDETTVPDEGVVPKATPADVPASSDVRQLGAGHDADELKPSADDERLIAAASGTPWAAPAALDDAGSFFERYDGDLEAIYSSRGWEDTARTGAASTDPAFDTLRTATASSPGGDTESCISPSASRTGPSSATPAAAGVGRTYSRTPQYGCTRGRRGGTE